MALDFFAGCVGGCAGVLVGHPLDTVKVHMQMPGHRYSNTFACLRELKARHGVRGLYKGLSSPMCGVAGINAMVFGVYGCTLRNLPNPESLKSVVFAGAVAGLSQSIICSPIELVKTRLQLSNSNSSPLTCMADILRRDGFKGLFRGLGLTAFRDAPGLSSYFLCYEALTRTQDNSPVSVGYTLFAGGSAGVFSWLLSFPMDVVKSRIQADGIDGPKKYTGALDCFNKSVAAEGYVFLSRGLGSVLLRAFPTNAACFGAVTLCMRAANGGEVGTWIIQCSPNCAAHAYKSLVFTGAFSEAICANDIRELHDDFSIFRFNHSKVPLALGIVETTLHS